MNGLPGQGAPEATVQAAAAPLDLRLLERLSAEPDLSQRGLAEALGVSLGLTNAFLKRLARKGLVKTARVNGRALRYLLTPAGLREKTRLAIEYLSWSVVHYRRARRVLADEMTRVVEEGVGRVAIAATPEWAEIAYVAAREAGIEVAGFSVPGRATLLGLPSVPWRRIASLKPDLVLVIGRRSPRRNVRRYGPPVRAVPGTDFEGIE